MRTSITSSTRRGTNNNFVRRIGKEETRDSSASAWTNAYTRVNGFSRKDLIVTIFSLAVVSWILLSWFLPPKVRIAKTTCSATLRSIYLADCSFSDDHGKRFPWLVPASEGGTEEFNDIGDKAYTHIQVLSNDLLVTQATICPQDIREPAKRWSSMANTNVSYFVGLNSEPNLPNAILAGDRNITAASSISLRFTESVPISWVKSVGLHG